MSASARFRTVVGRPSGGHRVRCGPLGLVGCLAKRGEDAKAEQTEGYCFFGALIGAVVFFVAILN